MSKEIVSQDTIELKIFLIRGQKVMLDKDLAELYGVKTKRLNEQVKRNRKRFPEDFMFQLTKGEKEELIPHCDRLKVLKHSTINPYAFTEQGVAMLSSVLKSDRAIIQERPLPIKGEAYHHVKGSNSSGNYRTKDIPDSRPEGYA